jgi:putative aldouronate transport system permease protein
MQNTNAQVEDKKKYKAKKDGFGRMTGSEIGFKIFAYVFVTIFALICLYPFVYAISAALSGKDAFEGGQVVLWPVDVQGEAFLDVFKTTGFWLAYTNTLFLTLFGTIWCMFIGILGGYALSKKRLFGNKFFNFALVFTMWFTAGMIPTYLNYKNTQDIFKAVGIIDEKWMVVIAMGMSAYNIILLRNAFESVPKEIEEAAIVDGANEFQLVSKIYTPMSKATIATVALFFGISRWNGYFWAKQMLTTTDAPLQVFIRSTLDQYQTDTEIASSWSKIYAPNSFIYAMIVCAIIPIIIIYPFIQKYFAAGVNLGGVKE